MKRFTKTLLALLLALALAVPARAAGPAESDVYYEQLNETARRLYDALDDPENLDCFYSGDGIEIDFELDGERFNAAAQRIFQANSYAFSAFELNHPELFWLSGSSDGIGGTDYEATLTVTPDFAWNWAEGGRSTYDDAAAAEAAVKKLAEEARAQGGRYAQLLYVHDWLTRSNVYNSDAAAGRAGDDYLPWTPLAALTDVSQPVCEGYAKAFKMVCDALGIPCVTVDGHARGGHMWNHVLLDGSWYAVDVTWDDPVITGVTGVRSGSEDRDYFLVGADTVVEGLAFSASHVPDGQRIAGTYFDFPALSAAAFDPAAYHEPEEPDEPDEPEPIVFADVSDDAYYSAAVSWAVEVGVTNGTKLHDENGQNWFSPDATVTRGQAVTFLWRAQGEPEPDTAANPFADVKETDYFHKAVLWAVENGITNGTKAADETGPALFSPTAPVKRGQMLTFLWRSVGMPGYTGEGLGGYADAEYWAYEVGALGDIAGTYATMAACPRCDVVYYLFMATLLNANTPEPLTVEVPAFTFWSETDPESGDRVDKASFELEVRGGAAPYTLQWYFLIDDPPRLLGTMDAATEGIEVVLTQTGAIISGPIGWLGAPATVVVTDAGGRRAESPAFLIQEPDMIG